MRIPDIRKTKLPKGRSINLALSHRGRKALKLLHIEEDILKEAIPMRGRFLHGNDGGTSSVEYDPISHQVSRHHALCFFKIFCF